MEVHKVISGFVAGFGYENNTLRVVIKTKSGLKAYDYLNVTAEDAGVFAQGLGKSISYIKSKYECKPVTANVYFSE